MAGIQEKLAGEYVAGRILRSFAEVAQNGGMIGGLLLGEPECDQPVHTISATVIAPKLPELPAKVETKLTQQQISENLYLYYGLLAGAGVSSAEDWDY